MSSCEDTWLRLVRFWPNRARRGGHGIQQRVTGLVFASGFSHGILGVIQTNGLMTHRHRIKLMVQSCHDYVLIGTTEPPPQKNEQRNLYYLQLTCTIMLGHGFDHRSLNVPAEACF